jgi:uncharacterized membrane protein HdeD (DUF308 family)
MNDPTNLQKEPWQEGAEEPRQAKPGRVLLAITVVRGVLAVLLGLALLAYPDKARPMLVNFMGLFLLVSGIMGLRWGVHGERPRPLALVIGAIGTLVGALILVRNLARSLLPELTVILLLGGSAVVMGILHLAEGLPNVREGRLERSWFSVLLGVFEVVLGLLVLYTPLEIGPGVYWAATIWSLAGAIWLFSQALVIRAKMRQSQEETA